ncbi:hypothetical protein [Roseibacillus persicicus]|uniref:hypothetical protein n=1 Tax=Roseibacillus persicicus TaxID=454148 RepID=UPI00280CA1C7|nr:hypothetical protein [Roseibacillus persicicus]MDQ8189164.1 hypothetical protein [Roseibacillus persicicus]
MKKQWIWTLALLLLLPTSLLAGSRGVSLAFLDATTGSRSKASLRLAELLEKDMRSLYVNPELATAFPWSEQDLELKVLKPADAGISFDRLLNTKDGAKIESLFKKIDYPDGLIVFFHDPEGGYARLKLYSWDGSEALLLRLPLEGKESAMSDSLMKGHRQGALIALGAAVRWSP